MQYLAVAFLAILRQKRIGFYLSWTHILSIHVDLSQTNTLLAREGPFSSYPTDDIRLRLVRNESHLSRYDHPRGPVLLAVLYQLISVAGAISIGLSHSFRFELRF